MRRKRWDLDWDARSDRNDLRASVEEETGDR